MALTAKEIANKYVFGNHDALTDSQELKDMESDIIDLISFHVTEALKQANEKAKNCHIDELIDNEVLNAYPLDLIK